MIYSNDAKEIIEECKSKLDPIGFLEIYVWHLCGQLEIQNERIKWLKEQLERA